ncbi:MAG: hypothetical protein KatS3mg115_0956 [Candidatus Poribacteria bacterium]|nr:MAG: hypothetical protein KatS3mg115_0956 [Candidatus Poribacteria bacterium]
MEATTVILYFRLTSRASASGKELLQRIAQHCLRSGATSSSLYRVTNQDEARYALSTTWYSEALYRQWLGDFLAHFEEVLNLVRVEEMRPLALDAFSWETP